MQNELGTDLSQQRYSERIPFSIYPDHAT